MKVEIEIPDPPEGWVYGGFRKAMDGEKFLDNYGTWVTRDSCYGQTMGRYPVAIKAHPPWTPPQALVDVLKPGWIAMDSDGSWYWHTTKPAMNHVGDWESGIQIYMSNINHDLLPCVAFDKSLFKIGEPQE